MPKRAKPRGGDDGPKIVSTSLRLPEHIYEACKLCAQSTGIPVSAFIVEALAQRVKNWRDPITGRRVVQAMAKRQEIVGTTNRPDRRVAGWVCVHSSHGAQMPASECPHGDKWSHRNSWIHPDHETNFNEWVESEDG